MSDIATYPNEYQSIGAIHNEKNRPFEYFAERYSPFYEGDDLWNIIIEKATSSRDSVNTLFGLE